MGKGSDGTKYWRDLKSLQFWLFTAVVNIILLLIWFGFNKLVTVMPFVRDIGYLVVIVAGVFAASIYLPRIKPLPVQGKAEANGAKPKSPNRIEHDGVLWEDGGRHSWGHIVVLGPLCPRDCAVLMMEYRGKIEELKYDVLISSSHYRLYCPECKRKYILAKNPKTANDSLNQVRNRFEGKRRREQKS